MYQSMICVFGAILNAMANKSGLSTDQVPDYIEHLLYNLTTSDASIVADVKFMRQYMREGAYVKKPEHLSAKTRDLLAELPLNPTLQLVYAKDFVLLVRENVDAIKCELAEKGWVF